MVAVERHREVVQFCAGLMSDPKPLIEHVYGLVTEQNLKKMRTGETGLRPYNKSLSKSLYCESQVELPGKALQNPWLSWCFKSDTQVYIPSRFYWFDRIKEDAVFNIDPHEEIPSECTIYIDRCADSVAKSLLSACRTVSQRSPISDLWLHGLKCDDVIEPDVFNLSHQAVLIRLGTCNLPPPVMNHLLHQAFNSSTIIRIDLHNTNLSGMTSVTVSNKTTSLTYLDICFTKMSAELCGGVCKHLKHLVHLNHLDLDGNRNIGAYSDYITDFSQPYQETAKNWPSSIYQVTL